jgi:hypothetical protein
MDSGAAGRVSSAAVDGAGVSELAPVSGVAASNRGMASATGVITGASVSRLSAEGSVGGAVPAGVARVAGAVTATAASAACFLSSVSLAWRSKSRISSSKADLKSVEALRNSAINFPKLRASSGNFWGPKTTRTTRKTTIIWGMLNIDEKRRELPPLHHRKGGDCCQTSLGKAMIYWYFS